MTHLYAQDDNNAVDVKDPQIIAECSHTGHTVLSFEHIAAAVILCNQIIGGETTVRIINNEQWNEKTTSVGAL